MKKKFWERKNPDGAGRVNERTETDTGDEGTDNEWAPFQHR
jgi:hypothetical protein